MKFSGITHNYRVCRHIAGNYGPGTHKGPSSNLDAGHNNSPRANTGEVLNHDLFLVALFVTPRHLDVGKYDAGPDKDRVSNKDTLKKLAGILNFAVFTDNYIRANMCVLAYHGEVVDPSSHSHVSPVPNLRAAPQVCRILYQCDGAHVGFYKGL